MGRASTFPSEKRSLGFCLGETYSEGPDPRGGAAAAPRRGSAAEAGGPCWAFFASKLDSWGLLGFKAPQDAPETLQDAFKTFQEAARRPRHALDAYKTLQDAPKSDPRAPKTAIKAILGRFDTISWD